MKISSIYNGVYQYDSFDLSGFKLLVLIDFDTNKLHHAEVRYGVHASMQIEHLRYKNKMTIELHPNYEVDKKYESGSAIGGGPDQLVK